MKRIWTILLYTVFAGTFFAGHTQAQDLADIRKSGVLRHLGVPYANFVTGDGQGLDVELMQLFAKDLGVRYQYVKTDWPTVIPDLIGKQASAEGDNARLGANTPVLGDVIANGLTVLPWRQQVLDFSAPTFPTQVWLVTGASSPLTPIKPSGSIETDILATKQLLSGKSILGKSSTCLDPRLYFLEEVNAATNYFEGNLNELAPAIMRGAADATLLDVADSLVALAKWPGQIKVLGPISQPQEMSVAFRKDSPELRQAFAVFYDKIRKDGSYLALVKKYYPDVFAYYPEFFTTR